MKSELCVSQFYDANKEKGSPWSINKADWLYLYTHGCYATKQLSNLQIGVTAIVRRAAYTREKDAGKMGVVDGQQAHQDVLLMATRIAMVIIACSNRFNGSTIK
jgi:hypothetical protein